MNEMATVSSEYQTPSTFPNNKSSPLKEILTWTPTRLLLTEDLPKHVLGPRTHPPLVQDGKAVLLLMANTPAPRSKQRNTPTVQ